MVSDYKSIVLASEIKVHAYHYGSPVIFEMRCDSLGIRDYLVARLHVDECTCDIQVVVQYVTDLK